MKTERCIKYNMNISSIDYSLKSKSLDIFFSGCNPPICSGCCNPELIDFNNGEDWATFKIKIDDYIKKYNGLIESIFLVGGSPNHQNTEDMTQFLTFMFRYEKPIWLFAREDLGNIQDYFKSFCSYIKTGAYIPELTCDDNITNINGIEIKLSTSNQKILTKGEDY